MAFAVKQTANHAGCRLVGTSRLLSTKGGCAICLSLYLFLYAEDCSAQQSPTTPGPRITFAGPIHDFGKVKSGDIVKHNFTFTNAGNQLLEVTNVQTSCGCTAANEWSRRVEPGQTGTIPIQFNTAGFGGEMLKTVTVYSTDVTEPVLVLQLKGTIWKPIDILPSFAVLNIMPDATSASTIVNVTNNTDEHIFITSEPKCSTAAFTAEIRTNQPGKAFQVEVKAVPPFTPGNSQAAVTVTTSSTNLPLISIGVWSIAQPRLAVIPPVVMLPPGPLAVKTSPTVTLQNNSTNLISVSDPTFPLTNVDLTFKEVIPGRAYTVTLGFPPGFEIPAGEPAVLMLKTSLRELPVVKVAINHLPKPAASN